MNTFKNLEMKPLKALETGQCLPDQPTPAIFTVGQLLASKKEEEDEDEEEERKKHECTKWLDEQPVKSVVFLCCGSMGYFDEKAVKKIALGLERSWQRFLWVLRTSSRENALIPSDADLGQWRNQGKRGISPPLALVRLPSPKFSPGRSSTMEDPKGG